ncbi:hypothetical protein AGOR_G00221340 [Albula goreensis]|uniref:U3 small nucleolar RNA-associated protein 13 C-terminal domain-containing protein n=1 Tax=Albula goreensis TaxID=1534307 RepID=A0A8T3CFU3_9TELE|nr:hypothetical protein AGOR_G00221340 [Albula goreensis]
MANNTLQFKTNYAVSSKIEPFYKGGKVQINKDEKYIFCTCGTRVNILEIATGQLSRSIEQDDQEDITSFALSPDDEMLVTASRALVLKQWDWKQGHCTRSWRAIHTTPIASMTFDPTSTLLATGGCDGTIKLWDVLKQYCTHNLKGSSGVVHLVQFHPDSSVLQLFSSSLDCGIRVWDLQSSQCVCVLQSHYSAVTGLAFTPDGSAMVSSGRDKICTVWDLKSREVVRTVPVYEAVEAVVILPAGGDFSQIGVKTKGLHFITAGSKGVLRVWEASSGRCVFAQPAPVMATTPDGDGGEEEWNQRSLTHCIHLPESGRITTVTAEHNLLLYQLSPLTLQQQFVGYNDEVLDLKFLGKDDSHIIVATNSPQLKVFKLATRSCQILYGHTDTVLSLDVFRKGAMFVSCAKDNAVRLWRMDTDSGEVGSVSCSRLKESFVVSGSLDCTIKLWDVPEQLEGVAQLSVRATEKAHDKDVNSVTVSPNDKLVASGSQDRTVKVWSLSVGGLALLGVCRGHRRGVWTVQFSPSDQILASASADGSIKLWGLQDFSCLKVSQPTSARKPETRVPMPAASVLKVIFVSRGSQLLSSGSDGLVKLWTIKTNECVKTLDAHQDKVWGLHASRKDQLAVTGSADSCITLWQDVTEVELAEEQAKQEDQILKQQELSNLLQERKFLKALGLAISLDQPHTVLRVIKEIRQGKDGPHQLENTVLKLRRDQKESLLRYCAVWNTNARSCLDAQAVMEVLLRHYPPEDLLQYQGARGLLEALIPYTERHMQRIGRLLQSSMFLDYMWQKMRVTGQSSVEAPGEDMDTSPIAQAPPLFTVDTRPNQEREGGRNDEEEEDDEEEEEQGTVEDQVDDMDVSVVSGKGGVKEGEREGEGMEEERKESVHPSSVSEESEAEGDDDEGEGQKKANGIGWPTEAPPLELSMTR